ncbi:lytic transglycosylase domain-containing protein [Undibacterium sp. LX40W]|uniref:Lytic transglycosylase domain-containing protein n=1 Tax=Undibacterium nitidum TaxID=2762298 RepID=A0A923KMQ2_9BURK|nr:MULTISPECIES: lytic transglycosylase domain-containing protein [Undibacterium]MBC3879753.1 lytic transglycosylase domain-containing protein [Undibacterium nitidum]MBC3891511.1 lytic transglycosylase domain-containing protein [Undibacterium sp. LX40W]
MIQNLILTAHTPSHSRSAQKEMQRLLAKKRKVDVLTTVLHTTAALGMLAIVILACMFFNPELATKFRSLSPFANSENTALESTSTPDLSMIMATPEMISQSTEQESTVDTIAVSNTKLLGDQRQQLLVTNWLSKRYRVANDAIDMLVSASYLTAKETKLDPLLILSVIAIESRFNPFSESPVGAQGLMQVMSKVHKDRFNELGGVKAALNPVANIKVGAMILRDCVKAAGSIEGGLKRYVGATDNETDGGYGNLVLAEYKRLKDVAAGKPVSIFSTNKPANIVRPQETPGDKTIDELTNEKVTPKDHNEIVAGI